MHCQVGRLDAPLMLAPLSLAPVVLIDRKQVGETLGNQVRAGDGASHHHGMSTQVNHLHGIKFTSKDMQAAAVDIGKSIRAIERQIRRAINNGQVKELGKGSYQKVK